MRLEPTALRAYVARAAVALSLSCPLARLTSQAHLRLGLQETLVCLVMLVEIAGYDIESIPGRPLPSIVVLRPIAQSLG